jgi:magnesium transporter
MTSIVESRPWESIKEILASGSETKLSTYIESLPQNEIIRAVCRLEPEQQDALLTILSPADAADIIEGVTDAQAADFIERLPASSAAPIVSELSSADQADVLGELDEVNARAILEAMEPEEAEILRRLASYSPDQAGGIMITEFLAYEAQLTVGRLIADMDVRAEEYADYNVQYIYVVSAQGELIGVLRLRDLLVSRRGKTIAELMISSPLFVSAEASLDELWEFFEAHDFFGVPVVDTESRLIGVVERTAVQEALSERMGADHMKRQGIIGGDEFRTMPVWQRSSRRLSWLSLNIVLNVISASVIAFYQDTLSSVIALAVFLPIISDMSGCSGNQAVAVSMRELTLGVIRPFEFLHVWLKEVSVGLINGLVLGILIAGVAWLWKGNLFLGAVVGGALALNTLVAVSIGGVTPLVLKRFKMDPALASGPIVTTVTDMCGFFLILSLATVALPYLLP